MSTETHEAPKHDEPPARPVKVGRAIFLFVVVALFVGITGVVNRSHEEEQLAKRTTTLAIPTVSVFTPKTGGEGRSLTLPGNVEAFYSATLHGQTSGYVSKWYKDIGAKVHTGDVLAVIDTPELDQQIVAAQGELAKARANLTLAKVTAQRWSSLGKSAAVSQQAVDEKAADAEAKQAELDAAVANLGRLNAQQGFDKIVAPFDGVVTARNVDIGTLVRADSSSGPPLFVVSDVHKMRIYVPVPEILCRKYEAGHARDDGIA